MTKAPSSIAAVRHDQLDGDDLAIADMQEQIARCGQNWTKFSR